jgi:AAA family ATP:ADP antiporter
MVLAFLICGEYAITRPASNALFLTLFSSKAYPWVWLATVPLNLFVIYLYNRFLPKIGPKGTLFSLAGATLVINALTAIFPSELIFFQYAWKDIYVLLMLKQLWSMIHSTIPSDRAKLLYGLIYGTGTLGAISGSLIPGFLAPLIGSSNILFFTTPLYLLLAFLYSQAYKRSGAIDFSPPDPRPREALSLIRRTPTLIAVLLLVIFMQVSAGLMEYQFNAHLELNIPDQDLRTAYCGKLVGLINGLSLFFQFVGGFLLVRTLGLRGSHFLVPILLGLSALCSLTFPGFAILSLSYVLLKAVDFSLFGVIREMLYVPLQLDAKFRAKAIIDVFAYRTSKALVSFGLLFLQLIVAGSLLQWAQYISIAVFIAWIGTVLFLFYRPLSVDVKS